MREMGSIDVRMKDLEIEAKDLACVEATLKRHQPAG